MIQTNLSSQKSDRFDKSLCFDKKQNIQHFLLVHLSRSGVRILSLSRSYLNYSFGLVYVFILWAKRYSSVLLMALLTNLQTLSYPFFSKLLRAGFNPLQPRIAAVHQAKVFRLLRWLGHDVGRAGVWCMIWGCHWVFLILERRHWVF